MGILSNFIQLTLLKQMKLFCKSFYCRGFFIVLILASSATMVHTYLRNGSREENKILEFSKGTCNIEEKESACRKITIPSCSLSYGSDFFSPPDTYNKDIITKECLIVGLATGYTEIELSPFVKSLRKHMNCEVQLVVKIADNGVEKETHDFFKKYKITPITYTMEKLMAILRRIETEYDLKFSMRQFKTFPPALQRYFIYDDIIKSNLERGHRHKDISASYVLLSDTKDVFFQDDVFKDLEEEVLFGAVEGIPPRPIAYQRRNYRWARDCYGLKSTLIQDSSQLVLCSGTVLGSIGAISHYLRTFLAELYLLAAREYTLPKRVKCVSQTGVDQGIHQHIMWNSNLSVTVNVKHINNVNDTLIGTVGIDADKVQVVHGFLSNSRGEKFAMVHQYRKFLLDICRQWESWN